MELKKGYKDITSLTQAIWVENNLSEKKKMLVDIINNDLYRATREKKYSLTQGVKRTMSREKVDKMVMEILMKGDKLTS